VKNTSRRPKIAVTADESGVVSQAGALLLTRALRVTGLPGCGPVGQAGPVAGAAGGA
jgi:hypothetical protein